MTLSWNRRHWLIGLLAAVCAACGWRPRLGRPQPNRGPDRSVAHPRNPRVVTCWYDNAPRQGARPETAHTLMYTYDASGPGRRPR